MTESAPILEDHDITVDGVRIFYRSNEGRATKHRHPLIHVHGFGISGTYLLPTAEILAADYPTYIPDLPGYGQSGDSDHTLSIVELADSLAHFLDAVNVTEPVTLIGNSMGCLISIEFGRHYPERVHRLIPCSAAGGPANQPLIRAAAQMIADTPKEPYKLYRIAIGDYLRFGLLNTLRLFKEMCAYPTIDTTAHLSTPLMYVYGSRDPLINEKSALRILDLEIPALIVKMQGSAHAVNFSHPEALASVIDAYLKDQPIPYGDAEDCEIVDMGSTKAFKLAG